INNQGGALLHHNSPIPWSTFAQYLTITRLMKEGKLRDDAKQRQVKYLNNRIGSDHAPIKKLVKAAWGFKRPNRAWSTLQGFETLRRLNKGQFDIWLCRDEPECRVRERSVFMNRLFNIETVLA
ncbi:transposase, partial [Yersinia aldovae]